METFGLGERREHSGCTVKRKIITGKLGESMVLVTSRDAVKVEKTELRYFRPCGLNP